MSNQKNTVQSIVNNNITLHFLACILADFVMTFAGCACSLENSMIRRAYGFTAYGGILFVIALWFSLTIHDGSKGNPCGNMISYMKGEIKLFSMLSRMIFQLLGGLVSYRYAKNFWYLGLTQVSMKVPYIL